MHQSGVELILVHDSITLSNKGLWLHSFGMVEILVLARGKHAVNLDEFLDLIV